jgi:CDP-diglyceride synthetase
MNIARQLKDGMARITRKLEEGLKCKFSAGSPGGWHSHVFCMLYFIFIFISYVYFKNIYLLLVLGLCIYNANVLIPAKNYRENDGLGRKIVDLLLSYPYLVVPSSSLIYLARLEKSNDIFLWIFPAVISMKISEYLFENIYGGRVMLEKLHPRKTVLGFLGTLIVSVLIGLISSLFFKQKFSYFIAVNLTLALLIHLQDFLGYWIENCYLNQKKDLLVSGYNNIALVTSFVASMIALGAIKM